MNEVIASRRRRSVVLAVTSTACLTGLLWWQNQTTPPPGLVKVGNVRSHSPDHSRIAQFELNLNDVPFLGEEQSCRLGDSIQVTGRLHLQADRVPSGAHMDLLILAIHPAGTSEEVWQRQNSRRELRFSPLSKEKIIDDTIPVTGALFAPGEYEVRAYLKILDMEGSDHSFDFLGSTKLTIVAE